MSDAFIGQIKLWAGNFAPRGTAFCNGQLLAIAQNSALFSIIGTSYGGDGRSTFGLPNLQGRVPIHAGHGPGLSVHTLGQVGGRDAVPLSEAQIPAHTHAQRGIAAQADTLAPANNTSLAQPAAGPYGGQPGGDEHPGLRPGGRRPAAQQRAAATRAELRDRAPGGVSVAQLSAAPAGDGRRGGRMAVSPRARPPRSSPA